MKARFFQNLTKGMILIAFALISSCGKEKGVSPNEEEENEPVETAEVTLTPKQAVPGQAVVITFNTETTLKDTVHVPLSGKTLTLYKTGNNEYTGITPVLNPGNHAIKLSSHKLKNPLALEILPYTAIRDAEPIINSFENDINAALEYFEETSTTGNNLDLLEDLNERFNTLVSELTESEKIELAYFIQASKPKAALFESAAAKPLRMGIMAENIGDRLVAKALEMNGGVIVAAGSVPFVIGSLYAIVKVPLPFKHYAALSAIVSVSTFIIAVEYASNQAGAVGSLSEVPAEILSFSAPGNSSRMAFAALSTTEISFKKDKERKVEVSMEFKSISQKDKDHPSSFVKKVLNDDNTLISIDKKVAAQINNLLDYLPGVGSYTPYSSRLPAGPASAVNNGMANHFSIMNVSDPAIKLEFSGSGEVLTFKASSATVVTEKEFTFDLVYQHQALDVKLTKTVNAVYDGRVFPEKIEITDGNNQNGEFKKKLTKPLKVKVIDIDGEVLAGVEVEWKIKSGGGTISGVSPSNDDGVAQAEWTLGDSGDQEVEAIVKREDGSLVTGAPALFKASSASLFGTWEAYEYIDDEGYNLIRNRTHSDKVTSSSCPGVEGISQYSIESAVWTISENMRISSSESIRLVYQPILENCTLAAPEITTDGISWNNTFTYNEATKTITFTLDEEVINMKVVNLTATDLTLQDSEISTTMKFKRK